MNGDAMARVRDRLQGWKQNGKEGSFQALCPAHDDTTPSLSVTKTEAGVLLKCHVGCDTTAVVNRLGLTMAELFDDCRERTNG